MSDSTSQLPPRPSLDQLRKQAKDRVKTLRAQGMDAMLADVQFALAREYGFKDWADLAHHVETVNPPGLRKFEQMAAEIAAAYSSGDFPAVREVNWTYGTSFVWHREPEAMHRELPTWYQSESRSMDLAVADARTLVARKTGFATWNELAGSMTEARATGPGARPNMSLYHLEHVDLMGTPTGDGALEVLTGKPHLAQVATGRMVTDAGLPLLHHFPVFRSRFEGEPAYDLMSFSAQPNNLLLDGPFTDEGLRALAGLEGLVGVNLFWHTPAFTAAGLKAFAEVPNLAFFGCDGKRCDDEAMRWIAGMPRLRMLMAQGTIATDAGFDALSRSPTIEYIWGRECPNLTGRGFVALAAMPALRGLAVSCGRVDDEALAMLPRFPALTSLMPMDVRDAGFRHVGGCIRLEHLWCMYCRDTTDVATEHLTGLSHLESYYAGMTKITDRSLEVLSRLMTLERLELWEIAGITDDGLKSLAALPRLREVSIGGSPRVTRAGVAHFAPHVRVKHEP